MSSQYDDLEDGDGLLLYSASSEFTSGYTVGLAAGQERLKSYMFGAFGVGVLIGMLIAVIVV